ncbi:hypothetical protein BMS3Abin06_01269 [bacterium BMS3Abin06]|nr:hypothetical protein BMS3Abin06_01269 [bacterium BMS3Abin06]
MDTDMAWNPLEKLIELFGEIITHDVMFVALLILSVIVIYISRSFFDKFKELVHAPVKFIQKKLAEIRARKAIKQYNHNRDELDRVRTDTYKQLQALNDPKREYAALQYFFSYPSVSGFKAIIEKAAESDNSGVRDQFICSLCQSLKANGWYDI